MKKYVSLSLVALSFVLFSCGKGKGTETTNKKDSTVTQTPPAPKTVQLKWKDMGSDEYDTPNNDIILSVDGKDSLIASILACDSIAKVDYERMQIPAKATTACGGWWAGAGEYFYAYIENGKVKVYYGWQAEEQEDEGYHWKEMDLNSKKKFEHFN